MPTELAEQLVAGIAAQDEAAIAACFAEDARFRALSPPGLRERSGAAEVGALIAMWYGDSTVLDLTGPELHVLREGAISTPQLLGPPPSHAG